MREQSPNHWTTREFPGFPVDCWWRFVVKSPAVMSSWLDLHACDLIFYCIWNEPVRELIENYSRAFSAKQELQLRQEAWFPAKLGRARPHWALGTKWEVRVGPWVWDTTKGNGQNFEAGRTGIMAQILASVNSDTYLYTSVYLQPRIMEGNIVLRLSVCVRSVGAWDAHVPVVLCAQSVLISLLLFCWAVITFEVSWI